VRRVLAIVLLVAMGGAAAAQEDAPATGRARDELVKLIDAYVLSNLQESLSLSDEQFVKLLPLVKKWQADRRGLQQRRQATLGEMRRLFEAGAATEPKLTELLKDLKAAEGEELQAVRRNLDAIDAQLSVVQQAQLRLFEQRVQQRLREIIERQRQQGAVGRRRSLGDQP
jgi:hypothetical protein